MLAPSNTNIAMPVLAIEIRPLRRTPTRSQDVYDRQICKNTDHSSRVLGHTKAEYLPSPVIISSKIRKRCHY